MKKAVALLVNDIHVEKPTIGDFLLNWDEVLEQCKANGLDTCFVGGDFFTSRSSQTLEVLMAVKDAIEKAEYKGINLYIALGNHDMVDQDALYGYPSLYDHHKNVTIINDKPFVFPIEGGKGLKLAVMRYWKENGVFEKKLDEFRSEINKRGESESDYILYVHEGIAGGLGDFEAPNELPKSIFSGFYKVLAAHYHFVKKIKNTGTHIEYIGSSRQKSHGEEGPQGYTLLWSDGSHSFIENQVNTRYTTIEKDYEEILNDDFLKDITDYRDDDYRVRLIVNCTASQAKVIDKQRLYDAGVTKLEVKSEEAVEEQTTDEDLSKKFDSAGVQVEYQTYCDKNNVDSELGMKYLKQI